MAMLHQYRREKKCFKCGQVKKAKDFRKLKNQTLPGWSDFNKVKRFSSCRLCENKSANIKYKSNPIPQLLSAAKIRAEKKRVEFNLTSDYLKSIFPPNYICPVLGIKMQHNKGNKGGGGGSNNSPTIDRIDSSKGYVKGNVLIISFLANKIKTDASVEQIEKVLKFYRRLNEKVI